MAYDKWNCIWIKDVNTVLITVAFNLICWLAFWICLPNPPVLYCCVHLEIEALNENIGRWATTWFTFIYCIYSVLIWWGTTSIIRPYKSRSQLPWFKKAKKFSSFFSKSEPNFMPFISCNYCMKKGHVLKNFYARKYDVPKGFMKWIPKGSRKA